MAKKTVNSDIYNLSQLVDDVKSVFIPDETEETLAIGTYGYIGALEAHRLQTQVQMTGELANEVFPSRARLERNVITHAIMANIEDINAIPAKKTAFLAIKEKDIADYFDVNNNFILDREIPLYIGEYEFHLEYDVELTRIIPRETLSNTYYAKYIIPSNREVPTSTVTNPYLSPPAVIKGSDNENYIYLTVLIAQVAHTIVNTKLVTSNAIDNKTLTFEFQDQLSYFDIKASDSDGSKYILPVFEGSSVPDSNYLYYCWYQYIDTNLIRVRFDRQSYMPGLNTEITCNIRTSKGAEGNFNYAQDVYVDLKSKIYGYKFTALLSIIENTATGRNRKSKEELQALIPKEILARGSITTITDLNNYFATLDAEDGRIVIQKKIDNQIERVYYAYLVAKDVNGNILPSNTIDVRIGLEDLIESKIAETQSLRYMLKGGACIKLGADGIGYINHNPIPKTAQTFEVFSLDRGSLTKIDFIGTVEDNTYGAVSISASVNGATTAIYAFPTDIGKRITIENSGKSSEVSDYMQLSVGSEYTYVMEYITKETDSTIEITDSDLYCFDFIEAWYYTENPEQKTYYGNLPMVISNLYAGTRVVIGIKVKLSERRNSNTTFTNGSNSYVLPANIKTAEVGEIASRIGIENRLTSAVSSDPSVIVIEEKDPEEGGSFKKYVMSIINDFYEEQTIHVTTEYEEYDITVNQDATIIANDIMIKETGIESSYNTKRSYLCYTPVIIQKVWPDHLELGDEIQYSLLFRASSTKAYHGIEYRFSRGFVYKPFSNKITYEDQDPFYFEPSEKLIRDTGFLYTNPYAVNINGYHLYSAFYMMSMRENPFLHFTEINDSSNVQFISTNILWNREFLGDNNDIYHLEVTLTQSVQHDLGLTPDMSKEPIIKCFAVFKKDGAIYRYRSLDFISMDATMMSFTYGKNFFAADVFDNTNDIKVYNMQVAGQKEDSACVCAFKYIDKIYEFNYTTNGVKMPIKTILNNLGILGEVKSVATSNENIIWAEEEDETLMYCMAREFSGNIQLYVTMDDDNTYEITCNCAMEYGYFDHNTEIEIYALCGLKDTKGSYSLLGADSIKPELASDTYTTTNVYTAVNGINFYHNYSEIMGSRAIPYGTDDSKDSNTTMKLAGYVVKNVPVLGYDYCQNEDLIQSAIDALNYRKTYIDNVLDVLENSFGIDFKLFNTYGPSKTMYIIKDSNTNNILDDDKIYIDRVNLSFYFRIKLTASNDSYTKQNIINEIKEYIEDLDDLSELHIPNLVTQITTNYKEQVAYFEYLGFNGYGADIQHIYKDKDENIDIHTAPEFININNIINEDGTTTPDINVYLSEI